MNADPKTRKRAVTKGDIAKGTEQGDSEKEDKKMLGMENRKIQHV